MGFLARGTDPATSHDAIPAGQVRNLQKAAILWLLDNVGPMADFELMSQYASRARSKGWPETQADSVRKRRAELKNEGRVVDTGETTGLPGRPASTIWAVA